MHFACGKFPKTPLCKRDPQDSFRLARDPTETADLLPESWVNTGLDTRANLEGANDL
jgi:hypothetical protein